MRIILALAMFLFPAVLFGGCVSRTQQQMTTVRLDLEDGTCSGTVVAPDVILSAGHCFESEWDESPTDMFVDGMQVKILAVVLDGDDHALVKVNFTFPSYALLAAVPEVGAHVHYWGNPAGSNNVYREGYVTNYQHGTMRLDVNGFFGDSGAGIFDSQGNVVGVISTIDINRHKGLDFRLMGAEPLEFTPLQYVMMGVHGI